MAFLRNLFILSAVIAVFAISITVIVPPAQLDKLFNDYLPPDIAQKLSGILKNISQNFDGARKVFSKEELKKYTGEDGSPGLYLAILGQVFDVSRGAKHYGPKGGYHFFTGML